MPGPSPGISDAAPLANRAHFTLFSVTVLLTLYLDKPINFDSDSILYSMCIRLFFHNWCLARFYLFTYE